MADLVALAACLAAFLAAAGFGLFHQNGGYNLETDFYSWYAAQAVGMLAGRPFTAAKALTAVACGLLGWVSYQLFRAALRAVGGTRRCANRRRSPTGSPCCTGMGRAGR